RGDAWQLVPARPPGSVWLDGHPVDGPRPLPFGVPFRVGGHALTLQPPAAAWDPSPPAREAAAGPPPAAGSERADRPRAEGQSQAAGHARWLEPAGAPKRGEPRFRAAGEKLRTAERRPSAPVRVPEPSPAPPAVPRPAVQRRAAPAPPRRVEPAH